MPTVLVVDDELAIANVVVAALEDEGYRVVAASNGIAGLECLTDSKPDIIISDFMMPFMDGAALVHAIRGNPKHQHVPILIVSAMPESVISRRITAHDGFLRKPFTVAALLAATACLLRSTSEAAGK